MTLLFLAFVMILAILPSGLFTGVGGFFGKLVTLFDSANVYVEAATSVTVNPSGSRGKFEEYLMQNNTLTIYMTGDYTLSGYGIGIGAYGKESRRGKPSTNKTKTLVGQGHKIKLTNASSPENNVYDGNGHYQFRLTTNMVMTLKDITFDCSGFTGGPHKRKLQRGFIVLYDAITIKDASTLNIESTCKFTSGSTRGWIDYGFIAIGCFNTCNIKTGVTFSSGDAMGTLYGNGNPTFNFTGSGTSNINTDRGILIHTNIQNGGYSGASARVNFTSGTWNFKSTEHCIYAADKGSSCRIGR